MAEQNFKAYGIALILGSLGIIATMIFHPTAHDLLADSDQVSRRGEIRAVATHSLALISCPVLLFGFIGLSRRLGWEWPSLAALTAFAFSTAAALGAAVASGLIAPVLTREILEAADPSREMLHNLLWYNGLVNQAFAKVLVVASFCAILIWSVHLVNLKLARITGIIGVIISLVSLAAFFAGHIRLDVHGFGMLVLAQSFWNILVGIFLFRTEKLGP